MLKILILTNRIPWPLKDGGALAMFASVNGYLQSGCKVSLLSFNSTKHWVVKQDLPEIFSELEYFETVDLENTISWNNALANLFSKKSFHLSRFISRKMSYQIKTLLENYHFDIIQLEGFNLSFYLPMLKLNSGTKIILRSHNIEHQIWKQYAAVHRNPMRKYYFNLQSKRICREEKYYLSQYDAILAMTQEDASFFRDAGFSGKIKVFPFGPDFCRTPSYTKNKFPSIYFLGALDWLPNLHGLEWFLSKVWPKLAVDLPDLRFFIAGRRLPERLKKWASTRILMIGEVPDAFAFSQDKDILVVPLFVGSGIRVKIIEAMSWGKAVICTPLAAQGIACHPGEDILLASDQKEFREMILEGLANQFHLELGRNARDLVENIYLNPKLIEENLAFIKELGI
ncbi:MAG: glycosyltransferase family 4 protein [Chitinophagaceae bacterium]